MIGKLLDRRSKVYYKKKNSNSLTNSKNGNKFAFVLKKNEGFFISPNNYYLFKKNKIQ